MYRGQFLIVHRSLALVLNTLQTLLWQVLVGKKTDEKGTAAIRRLFHWLPVHFVQYAPGWGIIPHISVV